MQLTTRGWSVAGATVGMYAAGRVLGTVEPAMLAGAGLVTLALGAVVVRIGKPEVGVRRLLRPRRLSAGTPALAEIEVVNLGGRRTGVLSVTDRFTGRREARFGVAPLRPGEPARGAFRIPTERRGVFTLGPLQVGVTDPLGLLRRVVHSGGREQVTVYPRVEAVTALPPTVGRDLVGGAVTDFSRSRTGTEFHSLREYETGDDLRRVHWRSTARTGQLMIREHDVPWQTRATLLLDDRTAVFPAPAGRSGPGFPAPAAFEHAVEATASVATALHRGRAVLRLLTTSGLDTGFGAGHEHYETIMERLAVASPAGAERFDDVAGRLHRQAGTGALVAFTGAVESPDLAQLGTLARRFGFVAAVRFADDGDAVPGLTIVDVPPGTPFAPAWNRAMIVRAAGRAS